MNRSGGRKLDCACSACRGSCGLGCSPAVAVKMLLGRPSGIISGSRSNGGASPGSGWMLHRPSRWSTSCRGGTFPQPNADAERRAPIGQGWAGSPPAPRVWKDDGTRFSSPPLPPPIADHAVGGDDLELLPPEAAPL